MDVSMNQNNNKDEILSTSSQPAPSSVAPISNKRPLTDSLTDLLATQSSNLETFVDGTLYVISEILDMVFL